MEGTTAAHMWRNDELTPKVRFNKIKWRGTINPMMGPATCHVQGWLTHSTNAFMVAKLTATATRRGHPSHIEWLSYLGRMNLTMRTLLMSAMVFPAASTAQTLQAPDLHPQGYTFTYGVSNQQPNGWDWTNAFSLQDVALEF